MNHLFSFLNNFVNFFVLDSYSLFKEYIFSIDDEKIESFHSLTYFESPDLTIPDIRLKLPKTKLQITEDTTYFLPNRVFSEGFSDYFIDLYKKEFNFDQIIVNYIDRNKKYQNMRLYLSKEKNHFSLLEFSVLKGLIKIFEFLMEETLSQNSEFEISYFIPLLLENGQFKIFQKMMIFLFPDNQTKIFDFIINQDLLMKIACAGNESFLLQLMKEYIIPLGSKKLIPENKLVFWTKKKDLNIKNINIFHLIAHFCMRSFLYCFLDYLLTFKFESDAIKMKYFLEEFLLMKDEETIQSSGINIQRTPIFYALKNKLYEIVNLCEIHDITFGDSPDIKELLLDLGLKNNSLGYFSKYLIANDAKDLCKVEKNNYFYERFQDHMKLLARLKAIFGSKQNNVTKKKKKNNYLEEKKKREEIIVKKKGKSKEAKIQNFEINLVLEALILGKKILEWDTSLREKVRLFLKQSKEKAILYLFLETFKSEVKNFEREDLLSIQNEAFILYLIDKFFPASKKTHEASLLNSFDIARKISLKNKSNDIMSQILLSQETINLMNLVIQKNHKLETINKEHQEVLKLKGIEIYRLLIFCLENKYYYALCYLMNLYPSEFLMIYEEYNITDSFFREYLVYNAHLSYRLLKILEKSSVYLLLEKEFNVFVETFFLFDESHNIKLLIESFKILFLLTTEEGYYNYSIFQITDAKSVEDCLLCIFRKIMTNIKNPLMVKKYLDSFSFEIRTLDLSEMLQYNYMLKTHNKQDIILKSFKAIWNYLLEENEKVKNRYHLDVDSLERFVFTIIEEKLHKIGADCKHNGVHLCLGISFMLSVLDGYGVYEELCNEFQNYEFVFYFKSETKGYNFLKNDDGKFLHVNINEEIYFDENNYALTYRFSIESYENLKVILKEETFMSNEFLSSLNFKIPTISFLR